MPLRQKTLLLIGVTFACLITVLYVALRTIILDGFTALEDKHAQQNVQRVVNTFARERDALSTASADYAHWDDTYRFLQGNYPEYIAVNMVDDTFANLDLNLIILVNASHEIAYAKALDLENDTEVPVPDYVVELFAGDSPFIHHEELLSMLSGVVMSPDGPLLIASVAVTTSQLEGPTAGVLVFGRYLDETLVARLSEQAGFPLALTKYDPQAPFGLVAFDTGSSSGVPISIQRSTNHQLAGYALLNDLTGNPALVLRVDMERDIYQQGLKTLGYLVLSLIAAGIIFGAVIIVLVERSVLRRLANLSRYVSAITQTNDPSARVAVEGQDELANLAGSINTMLAALEQTYQRVREQAQELRVAGARAKEAARIRGEFLANMSHELRTPLNAIIGFSDMLLMGMNGELNDGQRHKVQRLRENGARLLSLVNDVLDISRIQAKRVELVQKPFAVRILYDRIASQIGVLAAEKNLEFTVSMDSDLPDVIVGDEKRIEQIIVNLLSNAIKFTESGSVSLRSSANLAEKTWSIKVSDTGVGIPPHAHEIIFEEFRQLDGSASRAYKGSGLGLAISRNLVRIMGGTIQVESDLGLGSTFTVTLPLVEETDTQDNVAVLETALRPVGG
jgi:signal transduction histidine kinase